MNQFQYECIRRCIANGAPAMSEELLSSFDEVCNIYNKHLEQQAKKAATEQKKQNKGDK